MYLFYWCHCCESWKFDFKLAVFNWQYMFDTPLVQKHGALELKKRRQEKGVWESAVDSMNLAPFLRCVSQQQGVFRFQRPPVQGCSGCVPGCSAGLVEGWRLAARWRLRENPLMNRRPGLHKAGQLQRWRPKSSPGLLLIEKHDLVVSVRLL